MGLLLHALGGGREQERGVVLIKDVILCRCMEEGVVDVQGAEGGKQIADVGEG